MARLLPRGIVVLVDEALDGGVCPTLKDVIVYRRTGGAVGWVEGRDLWLHELLQGLIARLDRTIFMQLAKTEPEFLFDLLKIVLDRLIIAELNVKKLTNAQDD